MGKKHKKTPPALKKAGREQKIYVSAVHGDKIYYTKEFWKRCMMPFIAGRALWMPVNTRGLMRSGEDRAFAAARAQSRCQEAGFAR